ncbi:uncharacterized protein E0L32_004514 [Thyridium curvatum]|uniref:AMP-dependent synthetase/ligase domain-containing protein n=1 Tax=Thyridium curvatum TaxID=1093900 RepID=A0A507B643_9PEZI|nr:uncharacterized protein E0L32_004514 [Thyridium curvatum]TPX15237.1 hypothetical protein E0L32_004514 [Thyridium curvatum]
MAPPTTTNSWQHPSPHLTRVDAFRRQVNRRYGLSLETYHELLRWSVTELEAFCRELWTFCGVVCSAPPERVAGPDDGALDRMWPRPNWFPGARLNFTENMLAAGLAAHPDAVAVSACREGGAAWRHLTWARLRDETARYAAALRSLGVGQGDRVAVVTTNSVEALLVLLACGSVGAIMSSTASDMGAKGILERYLQIRPKVLFVESRVVYNGKTHDHREKLGGVVAQLRKAVAELEVVIDVSGSSWSDGRIKSLDNFLDVRTESLRFAQVPFDHPIYILYSSGTTGPPKCIVHGGGSALLQQKKDFILGFDLGPDSTYYQYTTTGWMMWNYLISALSLGARIVLYDGSPLYPSPDYQVQLLQEQGVTHYGTSPKFLAALKQAGIKNMPPLDSLQMTLSTGAPLSAEIFEWFRSIFPSKVGLVSATGGTDLVAGIIGGSPLLPVHHGELPAPSLGMAVEIWDANGKNIEDTGEKGDLVITKPFFSMPITFWGEGGEEKYRKAYFDTFPGVWHHGDFVRKIVKTQGYEVLGRSDGVLNPGGVRFGAAELYGIVDQFSEVQDCIAVGQRRKLDADEQVLLFLKVKTPPLSDGLRDRIRTTIRKQLSSRHVPAHILEVQDIPYTMNGKRIENLVKDVVCGRTAKVGGTAANPESLEEYEKFVDLPLVQSSAKL